MNHYPHLDWARVILLLPPILLFSACGSQDNNGKTAQHAPTKQEASGQKAVPSPSEPLAPAQANSNGRGALVGRVVFDGNIPQSRALTVSKDVEVCGKTEKFPEALLVGQDRGIKNAVVFLQAVAGEKSPPLPVSNPIIDQRDCVYTPHVLLVPLARRLISKTVTAYCTIFIPIARKIRLLIRLSQSSKPSSRKPLPSRR